MGESTSTPLEAQREVDSKIVRSRPGPDQLQERVQRRSMRVLSGAQILGSLGLGVGASIGILLAESVTNSASLAGLARTSTGLGAAVAAIPLAALAARWGRRKALGGAWVVAMLGAVLLVFAAATRNVPAVVVGLLMTGVGTAATLQSRFAATDCAKPHHRARALSLVVWAGTVGSVLGPNLGGPGKALASSLGLAPLSGAYILAALFLAVAALIVWIGLRPDPLLTRRSLGLDRDASTSASGTPAVTQVTTPSRTTRYTTRDAIAAIHASPRARFAALSAVLAQLAMVTVMTMTPIHMTHQGDSLEIVGLTISLHVLGMFAFSPVVGVVSDRFGAVPTILFGQAIFISSALTCALSPSTAGVMAGLFLLGLGWSFSLVPAATLLTESVPGTVRTATQGFLDMSTNAVAAVGAACAGVVMSAITFGGLALLAGAAVIPVVALSAGLLWPRLRPRRNRGSTSLLG